MPGKTKVYDEAAHAADILRDEIIREADADGRRTEQERRMVALADMVVAYTEATATGVRCVIRFIGGGMIDRRLQGQVRDVETLMQRVTAHYPDDKKPTQPPAMRFYMKRKAKAPVVAEAPRSNKLESSR